MRHMQMNCNTTVGLAKLAHVRGPVLRAVAHKRYDRKPVMAPKQHTTHMSGTR